eukprot:11388593-Karenia_brevis.AAC.1
MDSAKQSTEPVTNVIKQEKVADDVRRFWKSLKRSSSSQMLGLCTPSPQRNPKKQGTGDGAELIDALHES